MHIAANQDAAMCIDFDLENPVDYLD